MHGRRRFAPFVLLLVVGLVAAGLYLSQPRAAADGALTASGTIEATVVTISPEVSGRVTAVNAAEGDAVTAGAAILTLDATLLTAQRGQAEAAIAVATANVKVAEANVAAAEADVARADAATAAAKAAVVGANEALDGARAAYNLVRAGASSSQLGLAGSQVTQARATWTALRDAYDALSAIEQQTLPGRTLKAQRDTAKAAIATAQAQYAVVRAGSRSQQVDSAQAAIGVAGAQAKAAAHQADAAAAQADAARARVDGAKASAEAAAAALDAATAGLAVADAQIARLTVIAPIGGTVLTRTVEPGGVVSPGAALMELADLDRLTLTVYVPENRYGQVSVGGKVDVTVDSFPGVTFTGTVSRIADQAEFTPRNVQTVDGRTSTVFAVKLALDASGGKLKPGMPADVTFR
ncbi:MAG: efflux RND transporter periplasmic adaptor subunit [Chloroflexota bacterium]